MTLYVKAGPDGISFGDCPFAHYVRMVLHEKQLEYDLCPCTAETKPTWLIDTYGGSMPALRHRKECYVDSEVIVQYLDFFFPEPSLSSVSKKKMNIAKECLDGFFPTVAQYFKHTTTTSTNDGDEKENEYKHQLEQTLQRIETYLSHEERQGPYFVDTGKECTLIDCSLAPKLYHLIVGLQEFKANAIDISSQYPKIQKYYDFISQRDSFQKSLYSKDVIIWGWTQARNKK